MPAYETTDKGFELLLVKAQAEIAILDMEVTRLESENGRLSLQVKELSDAYARETHQRIDRDGELIQREPIPGGMQQHTD